MMVIAILAIAGVGGVTMFYAMYSRVEFDHEVQARIIEANQAYAELYLQPLRVRLQCDTSPEAQHDGTLGLGSCNSGGTPGVMVPDIQGCAGLPSNEMTDPNERQIDMTAYAEWGTEWSLHLLPGRLQGYIMHTDPSGGDTRRIAFTPIRTVDTESDPRESLVIEDTLLGGLTEFELHVSDDRTTYGATWNNLLEGQLPKNCMEALSLR